MNNVLCLTSCASMFLWSWRETCLVQFPAFLVFFGFDEQRVFVRLPVLIFFFYLDENPILIDSPRFYFSLILMNNVFCFSSRGSAFLWSWRETCLVQFPAFLVLFGFDEQRVFVRLPVLIFFFDLNGNPILFDSPRFYFSLILMNNVLCLSSRGSAFLWSWRETCLVQFPAFLVLFGFDEQRVFVRLPVLIFFFDLDENPILFDSPRFYFSLILMNNVLCLSSSGSAFLWSWRETCLVQFPAFLVLFGFDEQRVFVRLPVLIFFFDLDENPILFDSPRFWGFR